MKKYYTDSLGKQNWENGKPFIAFSWDPKTVKADIYSFTVLGPIVPKLIGYLYHFEPGVYRLSEFKKEEV